MGAFSALAFWGLGMLASCLLLPAPRDAESGGKRRRRACATSSPSLGLCGGAQDARHPIVAAVMMVAILRIAGFGIQSTFYAAPLEC